MAVCDEPSVVLRRHPVNEDQKENLTELSRRLDSLSAFGDLGQCHDDSVAFPMEERSS